MFQAFFNFSEELNIFLPSDKRNKTFPYYFDGTPSVKHLIEALGVAHTEIGAISVNSRPVDLSYLVHEQDHIQVTSATALTDNYNHPDLEPHFILDNHLGKLAVYLRMLGFDSLYRNNYQDQELAQVSSQEKRILLTRDRRLLMRSIVLQGYCLRSLNPIDQMVEVCQRYNLTEKIKPFQRCLCCNSPLDPISKGEILPRLQPLTRKYYDEFHICPVCDKIYWKGSHYEHMQQLILNAMPGRSQRRGSNDNGY
jgi:uncharacterized protein